MDLLKVENELKKRVEIPYRWGKNNQILGIAQQISYIKLII